MEDQPEDELEDGAFLGGEEPDEQLEGGLGELRAVGCGGRTGG